MKYEYKMVMKFNDDLNKELGIQGGIFSSTNRKPVDMPFADELGVDGFEMFQVVQYGMESCYYFRRRIN